MGTRKKDPQSTDAAETEGANPFTSLSNTLTSDPDLRGVLEDLIDDPEKLLNEFGLSEEDILRIKKMAPLFRKKKDEFVEKFYERILAIPQQKKFFESPEQLNRVKEMQGKYFIQICEGRYDRDYISNRLQVGQVHNRINLPIIYYLGAMNFYRSYVCRLIDEEIKTKRDALATLTSFEKLVQLDAVLVTQSYVLAREQTIREQTKAMLELSTPVIQIWNHVLMLPLVGTIDTQRAHQVVEKLLPAIVESESRVVIIDVRGVPVIDTRVAAHLMRATAAARLLGAEVLFTGFSPHIAQTLTKIEADITTLKTVGTMHNALRAALKLTGQSITAAEEDGGK